LVTALSSNNRDSSRETASTACTRFREPVQPPATGEDRLDRTDARKGKIMAGPQRPHVTAMSPHAGTRQNGLAFRKLEANRINQIAAGVTGWIPTKRFRFPLASPIDSSCFRYQGCQKKRNRDDGWMGLPRSDLPEPRLTGQSVPILRRCHRDLVHAHQQLHFAQAECGLQELSGGLTGYRKGPNNPDPCRLLLSKTGRTKRRNASVSSDYAGLI
jgi:hypothetical protein